MANEITINTNRQPILISATQAKLLKDKVEKHPNSHDININDLLYTRQQLIMTVRKLLQIGGGYTVNDAKQLLTQMGEPI